MTDGLSQSLGKQLIGNLRVKADPFGIYKERRLLGVKVYRGDEWWTAAADKMIQSKFDDSHASEG